MFKTKILSKIEFKLQFLTPCVFLFLLFSSKLLPIAQAQTLIHTSVNSGSWKLFEDPILQISIQYPEDWYEEKDPAFQKPTPVFTDFERRVAFAGFENPIFPNTVPDDACKLEMYIKGSNSQSLATMKHSDKGILLNSRSLTLDNKLKVQELQYDFTQIGHYNHREFYIPYDKGVLVLVAWATGPNAEKKCSRVFKKIIKSLRVEQKKSIQQTQNSISPLQQYVASIPQKLDLPFAIQEQIQQGWKYTYSTAFHGGIDYIDGDIDQTSTWKNFNVLAAANGDATYIGNKAGWGNTVVVKHEFSEEIYYTLYAHLESWDVPENGEWQSVNAREKIGVAGKSGSGSGDSIHLHFEFSKGSYGAGSERLDPYDLYFGLWTTRNNHDVNRG